MILKKVKIKKKWTDYNGHMNVAFYIHVFDISAEFILNKFNMGGKSAKKNMKSTFVVESHTTYNREVRLGEEVEVHLTYLDHDNKRIHFKLSMIHKQKKYLAATNEVLSLYIDLKQRKVSEFENEKMKAIDDFIKKNSSKFTLDNLVLKNKLKK